MAAWANAANAAMLAEAFRIAGQTSLMTSYRDAAITAYNYASGLADPMLDATQDIGDTTIRGRDLKMTAAAFLYNVTGSADVRGGGQRRERLQRRHRRAGERHPQPDLGHRRLPAARRSPSTTRRCGTT